MEHGTGQGESQDLSPDQLLFEGSEQHTIEILPHMDRMPMREREQSVIAGVGRSRVSRQVGQGRPAARVAVMGSNQRADELLAVTYQVAAFFTIVIVGVILAAAVMIVVTSSAAR